MGEDTTYFRKQWYRNFELWIYGLFSAAIGGAANSVGAMIVTPETVNIHGGLKKLLTLFGISAIISTIMYLQKSPLPQLPKQNEENKININPNI